MIEQLRSILCTAPSVEKDVKEVKIWTFVEYKINGNTHLWILQKLIFKNNCFYWWDIRHISDMNWEMLLDYNNSSTIKIKWNPLSLKHLMMYCNESKIFIEFNSSWDYWTIIDWYEGFLWKYDITKELHEQEEETLVDIINFLKGV